VSEGSMTMKYIKPSLLITGVLLLCLFWAACARANTTTVNFELKRVTNNGQPPIFADGTYSLGDYQATVSQGVYAGLAIGFSIQQADKSWLRFNLDIPNTQHLSVWEKNYDQKTGFQFEYKIGPLPLKLKPADLVVEADARLISPKHYWKPRLYIEKTTEGIASKPYIQFDDFDLTITAFSIQGPRLIMKAEFTGKINDPAMLKTVGAYEIKGTLTIDSSKEITIMMTD